LRRIESEVKGEEVGDGPFIEEEGPRLEDHVRCWCIVDACASSRSICQVAMALID
jgi:hypothetical protein